MMNYTTEQLRQMEHDQLMQLVNDKQIDWSQYIDAQPDLYEGYDEWLQREGRERNNENALFFIHQTEERDMQSQMPDELNTIINEVRKAKSVL
jgi:hypothetical protein